MLASVTPLPVIGVPVPLKHLDGMDSLLSIVQMPAGVPVATVSVAGARNAGTPRGAGARRLRRPSCATGWSSSRTSCAGRPRRRARRSARRRDPTGAPASEDARPRRRGSRLVGVDVARCLALLGMMATHVLAGDRSRTARSPPRSGSPAAARRRCSPLLAGVSLALMTGGREPVRGQERLARSAGLAVRALLIAFLGLMLGEIGSGPGGDPDLLRRAVPAGAAVPRPARARPADARGGRGWWSGRCSTR